MRVGLLTTAIVGDLSGSERGVYEISINIDDRRPTTNDRRQGLLHILGEFQMAITLNASSDGYPIPVMFCSRGLWGRRIGQRHFRV